jgi:hypothetical protein
MNDKNQGSGQKEIGLIERLSNKDSNRGDKHKSHEGVMKIELAE